ncbi:LAS seventeen-binding protein 5 [Entomortierella parvispora]|uniref:LAS seventeen-binding protein 5 n=1 Tax=Entomortierella parvispora TaxID=205924 RepID=A0A9P3HEU0_9FUNG|nr:LAS seventeen-binding protein 5 [Entomortierella parvispora]
MGLFSKQTAIGTQIDAITGLPEITQWDAVVGLCDAVNAKDDGAKEAAKALRKKLRMGRPQQQMNAISLIQAMVDGCGSKFKAQLATSKFTDDIQAVLVSDTTDVNVKIRLMERLQSWADQFASDPGLAAIPQLCYHLIKSNTPRSQQHNIRAPGSSSPPRAPITPEQQMRQMAQDIEVARNNAHMLIEAVSFADPEMEAIEENELIKEFHSKCTTLQRGIQQYLSEMTEAAAPDEQWLTALLACNQELVQAFTAYNQMMERQHLNRVTKASEMVDVVPPHSPEEHSPSRQQSPSEDLISLGAGVGGVEAAGNGHAPHSGASNGNGLGNGNGKGVAHNGSSAQPDPFADEPYYVTGPADVNAAVKMGKRADNQDKIFDASAYFRQQQLEQEQLEHLKQQQRQLHEESLGGSSQPAATGSVPATTLP